LVIGSKAFGLRCLEHLSDSPAADVVGLMTLDDRDDPRNAFEDLQAGAAERGVPFVVTDRASSSKEIKKFSPDLCVVAGWYWLIDDTTLYSVPMGFVGLHFSLLPLYRGGSPLVWAMINGETSVGVSLFSFETGMDEGPIWGQATVPVERHESVGDVLPRLEIAAVELLGEAIPAILDGTAAPRGQDHSRATYCAQRRPEDGKIDWALPAERVHDFIRAQSHPYPGAFTVFDGQNLTLWSSREIAYRYYGTPGQVVFVGDEVAVVCGDAKPLAIGSVQTEGGPVQPAREVLRSLALRLG